MLVCVCVSGSGMMRGELRALSLLLVIAAEAHAAQRGGKAYANKDTHIALHKHYAQETCVSLGQRLEKMPRMAVSLNPYCAQPFFKHSFLREFACSLFKHSFFMSLTNWQLSSILSKMSFFLLSVTDSIF